MNFLLQDYVLIVDLKRCNVNRKNAGTTSNSIYCPRYPKGKTESWFLTLGSQATNELLAMKRISIRGLKTSSHISFQCPPRRGHLVLTLYLMSDCLIGLDQQFDLQFEIIDTPKQILDAAGREEPIATSSHKVDDNQ